MKKVLFTMMAALLICGMSFAQNFTAQRSNTRVAGMVNSQENERSGWIGTTNSQYVLPLLANQFAAFVPKAIDPAITGAITKLKIGVCNWENFAGGKMRIGFYPVPSLTPAAGFTSSIYEIPTLGAELYGEDIDLTSIVPASVGYGNVGEVTLGTPFNIPQEDFWIVITAKENICLLYTADGGVANEWYGVLDATEYGYGYLFADNSNTDGSYSSLTLSAFVDDGSVYVNQSDLQPYFYNSINNPTALVTTLSIGESDDLVLYPVVANNGPDVFKEGSLLNVSITIDVNGVSTPIMEDYGDIPFDLTTENICIFGAAEDGYAIIIENSEILEIIGDATDFIVTMTVETADGLDPDVTNNTVSILVTIIHLTPVQNLEANVDGANVTLTWDAPSRALQGYLIYRDGEQIGLKPAAQTTYTDSNVADGEHEYCVIAKYNEGNAEEACISVTTDGINNIDAESVAVYPNPATNFVKVANAEGANISIINNIGQVIANINNASADQEINVSSLANGIYTIRIANDSNVTTRQFSVKK